MATAATEAAAAAEAAAAGEVVDGFPGPGAQVEVLWDLGPEEEGGDAGGDGGGAPAQRVWWPAAVELVPRPTVEGGRDGAGELTPTRPPPPDPLVRRLRYEARVGFPEETRDVRFFPGPGPRLVLDLQDAVPMAWKFPGDPEPDELGEGELPAAKAAAAAASTEVAGIGGVVTVGALEAEAAEDEEAALQAFGERSAAEQLAFSSQYRKLADLFKDRLHTLLEERGGDHVVSEADVKDIVCGIRADVEPSVSGDSLHSS